MLLLDCGCTFLPEFVQLLVLAVLFEVIKVVFLLEDPREASGVLLCIPLSAEVLLNDIVVLEVMEIGVLTFEQIELVFDLSPSHQRRVTCFLEYSLSPGVLNFLHLHVRDFSLVPASSNDHPFQFLSINNY